MKNKYLALKMIGKKRFFTLTILILLILGLKLISAQPASLTYVRQGVTPEKPESLEIKGAVGVDLFTGAANYRYNLDIPPGTNGLKPEISLSYTSQSLENNNLGSSWRFTCDDGVHYSWSLLLYI